MCTPRRLDVENKAIEMKRRLENCWETYKLGAVSNTSY